MHDIDIPSGPVAVKKLNMTNPTEQQLLAFKNEVGVLRLVVLYVRIPPPLCADMPTPLCSVDVNNGMCTDTDCIPINEYNLCLNVLQTTCSKFQP